MDSADRRGELPDHMTVDWLKTYAMTKGLWSQPDDGKGDDNERELREEDMDAVERTQRAMEKRKKAADKVKMDVDGKQQEGSASDREAIAPKLAKGTGAVAPVAEKEMIDMADMSPEQLEAYQRKDMAESCRMLWDYVRGDRRVRPSRRALLEQWLKTVDTLFLRFFVHDPKAEESVPRDVELMLGQQNLPRADAVVFEAQKARYVEEVISYTQMIEDFALTDPRIDDEDQKVWKGMTMKIAVMLLIPRLGRRDRPWFPIFTHSVYKVITR